jgi:hypothetical protein
VHSAPASRASGLLHEHANDVLAGDRVVDTAVGRVHAVVAKDIVFVFAAGDELVFAVTHGKGGHVREEIGFVQLAAVKENETVFEINGIARNPDDAFYRIAAGGRVADYDDVGALWSTEMIDPAIQKVMFGVVQGRDHAASDDLDGLDQVMADQVVAGYCEAGSNQGLGNLLQPGSFSACSAVRACERLGFRDC